MPADPQVVEATKTLSSTLLPILIPGILIAGAVGVGIFYLRIKLEKKADEIARRRREKNRQ